MSASKILITAAGPNMMPVLEGYSLPAFKRFADEHGYTVHVEKLAENSAARKSKAAKEARWQKIRLMRQALEDNDVAVLFDADVLICRFDQDIADNLAPSDYQGLVLHDVPAEQRINPNTGVWVMRRTQKAFDFLAAVEGVGMPEGRWSDQGAVMAALGWIPGDDRYHGARMPEVGSEFLDGTAWLPIGWNQPYMDKRPNPEAYVGRPTVAHPYAVHFMAMTIADRLLVMGDVAQQNEG